MCSIRTNNAIFILAIYLFPTWWKAKIALKLESIYKYKLLTKYLVNRISVATKPNI